MAKKIEEIWATGRRKCAIARVRIKPGTGVVVINGNAIADYLPGDALQGYACQPLKTVEMENKIDVTVTVDGGGKTGQAGAIRHGVSRALCKADPELRGALKKAGFLTRDPRMKERKKYGLKAARRAPQFSKR